MNAVEVRNVSRYYALGDSQWTRLGRIFSPAGSRTSHELRALHDITFSVAPGEALGIIGANGSGKSTLLQIIAGILQPTTGTVEVNGRCSTLLELGSGFAPEFTGRQNVYLNATILGLSREEIEEKFEAIHRFSGIGDFIDQPIRTYSTGMVLRLAFAVAAHIEPRILIVDEALAVGDIVFRQRCMRRIHELRAAGVTILFVSHDTGDVKALCERCLWLERGVVRGLGQADEIVLGYLAATLDRPHTRAPVPEGAAPETAFHDDIHAGAYAIAEPRPGMHRFGNGAAEVTGVSMPSDTPRQDTLLRLRVHGTRTVASPIAGFLVRNNKGESIFGTNSARENHPLPVLKPGDQQVIDFHFEIPRLAAGTYSVSVAIADGSIGEYEVCDYIEDAFDFDVHPEPVPVKGYMKLPCHSVTIHRRCWPQTVCYSPHQRDGL